LLPLAQENPRYPIIGELVIFMPGMFDRQRFTNGAIIY
jgi:hypothetical protein